MDSLFYLSRMNSTMFRRGVMILLKLANIFKEWSENGGDN
ncbi:protein of unknown function [Clostridium beijerinckii]|nr:protein of unknown function [Clostridium beijerinckii]